MNTLCVVTCGKKKIWDREPDAGPTPAEEVYIGPLAVKCKEYARKFHPSSWCILSAKHGFLFPNELVRGPYNASFSDPKTASVGARELSDQAIQKGLSVYDRVVVLGGRNYVRMVEQVFGTEKVSCPLKGCRGNGEMMGILKRSVLQGTPL